MDFKTVDDINKVKEHNLDVGSTKYLNQIENEKTKSTMLDYMEIDPTEFNGVSIHYLDGMRAGEKYIIPIKIRDLTIELRPLTIFEADKIEAEVLMKADKLPACRKTHNFIERWTRILTIFYASQLKVLNSQPTISQTTLFAMTVGEIDYIYQTYMRAMEKINPWPESLTTEKLDEWIDLIKKNPGIIPSLHWLTLQEITLHLVETFVPQPMDNIPL